MILQYNHFLAWWKRIGLLNWCWISSLRKKLNILLNYYAVSHVKVPVFYIQDVGGWVSFVSWVVCFVAIPGTWYHFQPCHTKDSVFVLASKCHAVSTCLVIFSAWVWVCMGFTWVFRHDFFYRVCEFFPDEQLAGRGIQWLYVGCQMDYNLHCSLVL